MGPTNVALVGYYQADQLVRAAQARLDTVTKDVRVQERKVNELLEKQKLLSANHNEARAKAANLELDIKIRTEHIEKLRTQQQVARNNKEYQVFLIEINTGKVDKSRVEEETMKAMQLAETLEAEVKQSNALLDQEQAKLTEAKGKIDARRKELEAEIAALQPHRDEASAAVPPRRRSCMTSWPIVSKAKHWHPSPNRTAETKNTCAMAATWSWRSMSTIICTRTTIW